MDEICLLLYKKIGAGCAGVYNVFYEDELCDALPERLRNRDTLEAALKFLAGGGYIDVKYARGNVFCIKAVKSFLPSEGKNAEEPSPAPAVKRGRLAAVYALCSFLAALAGGLAGALIGAAL